MSKSLAQVLERANRGIVGIDAELEISTGYDSGEPGCNIETPSWWDAEERGWYEVSRADRLALADMMIDRWTRYRAAIEALPTERT